jgi:hypothetical protein
LIEFSVGLNERVLHDIFTIQHRTGHTRAVAVQAWAELTDRLKKGNISRFKPAGWIDVFSHISIYVCHDFRDTCGFSISVLFLSAYGCYFVDVVRTEGNISSPTPQFRPASA